MTEVRFVCRKCGHRFVARVFEKGEAEEKRLPVGPARCPRCSSYAVERAS
jgi:predicted Zn-ribbon and HTH transcriptional regulator